MFDFQRALCSIQTQGDASVAKTWTTRGIGSHGTVPVSFRACASSPPTLVPPSLQASDIAKLFATEGPASDTPVDVPVEHLDYEYVEKCSDVKELVAILQLLRSGKEGRYAHLEQYVETRLLDVMPPAQRKCVCALGLLSRFECWVSPSCRPRGSAYLRLSPPFL